MFNNLLLCKFRVKLKIKTIDLQRLKRNGFYGKRQG